MEKSSTFFSITVQIQQIWATRGELSVNTIDARQLSSCVIGHYLSNTTTENAHATATSKSKMTKDRHSTVLLDAGEDSRISVPDDEDNREVDAYGFSFSHFSTKTLTSATFLSSSAFCVLNLNPGLNPSPSFSSPQSRPPGSLRKPLSSGQSSRGPSSDSPSSLGPLSFKPFKG